MLFNSLTFLIFALVFYALWPWMAGANLRRWVYLTAASFVFYGWWDFRFLILIVLSGLLDFAAGGAMTRYPHRKRFFLILSIAGNIGSLAIFKYSRWLAAVFDAAAAEWGWSFRLTERIPAFALILPVGISFYTFQSMSYTLDIYRGTLKPTRNVFHFFAYLSLFPQLVAGPIIRARDLLTQLETHRKPKGIRLWHGFRLIVTGLFQKIVLADHIGVFVTHAFADVGAEDSALHWWLVMMAFSFQIYFDFSGYSMIARGLAKWMGLHFKLNFNHPYLAYSLRDFWRRWHISLSEWFRDYLYIPLGGAKVGRARVWFNLWIVLLVSGLWHGANGTFVMWGACHAFFLTVERLCWGGIRKVWIPLRHVAVMLQVTLAWVFFRAPDLDTAWHILGTMFSFPSVPLQMEPHFDSLFFLALALLIEGVYALGKSLPPVGRWLRRPALEAVELGALLVALVFYRGPAQVFLYFQF